MLKTKGMVKTVLGANDLSLIADAGESFRVRGIRIFNPAADYINITVDKVLVQYLRAGGSQDSHVPFPVGAIALLGLYDWMVAHGIFRPIPIAKGQTLTITGANQAGAIQQILYDQYDSDDVRSSEPNGTNALEYDYINYGRYSTILAAGDNLYATQQTSNQFPPFPFGKIVPSKTTMILRGIAFSDVAKEDTSGTNQQHTTYLKFVKDRETLFDEDRNGLLYCGALPGSDITVIGTGSSQGGNQNGTDGRPPLWFDPPLSFVEGDDLDLYVSTLVDAGAANIAAEEAEIGLLFNVRRV